MLERLCKEKGIPLNRVEDNAEFFEEVTRNYGTSEFKRIIYSSNTEDIASLTQIDNELVDWGFITKFRIPHSS